MDKQKEKILVNFKKAQGSISRIIEMTKEGRYCIDIMQQNLAVIGLLKSAHQMLMENHLNTCVKKALGSKDEKKRQAMIEEVLKVSKIANK